jgi:hypothetical protein
VEICISVITGGGRERQRQSRNRAEGRVRDGLGLLRVEFATYKRERDRMRKSTREEWRGQKGYRRRSWGVLQSCKYRDEEYLKKERERRDCNQICEKGKMVVQGEQTLNRQEADSTLIEAEDGVIDQSVVSCKTGEEEEVRQGRNKEKKR